MRDDQVGSPQQTSDPYQPPRTSLVESEARATAEELVAFMTGHQPGVPASKYYERQVDRWERGQRLRFHFPALLVGTSWCFWRKLYLVGFMMYLLEFVLGLVLFLIGGVFLQQGDSVLPSVISLGALLLARVPLAFTANRLYIWRAERAARRVAERGLRGDEADLALRRLGGTSALGLAVAILINLALRLLAG
ncbi:MAG: DUF2628 domain-containing protein [Thermoanaerobaculia bacterium]|nr:DUF2628 domain-containing protein [Thermoanaerobaculia bacterium]